MNMLTRCFALTCGLLWLLLPAATAEAIVLAHYTFDDNFNDFSGNNRHGTLSDVGTLGNSGITNTAGEYVFGGGALNLSTDRDAIHIPSHTFGSGTPYSISFWAKRADSSNQDWDMVIGQRSNTNNNNFFLALGTGDGAGGLRWRSSNSSSNRQADFTTVVDNEWHHYVLVGGNDGTITLYQDGDLVSTAGGKQTGFIIDTIGDAYNSATFSFFGQIDEVWILTEAIGIDTVRNLYTHNSLVPEPSTYALALLGLLGVAAGLRRRRKG